MSDPRNAPRLPPWWSRHIDAAWRRSRDAAVSDWSVRGDHSSPLDASIVEHALAFGHGARSAYARSETWDSVAPQLRDDWMHLGNTGIAAWENVVDIIQHEWRRAAGPGGDAAPEGSYRA